MNERPATRLVLRLFPAEWRNRYGEEFAALLAQTGLSPGVAYDVLLAAADARLNFRSSPRGWPLMIQRLRRSELIVFVCWVVFAVAGSGFGWMTKDEPFVYLRATQLPVALAFDAVVIGAIVSAVALSVAGVPLALAIARDALSRGQVKQLVLLAVPFVAVGGWFGLTLLLAALVRPPVGDAARIAIAVLWLAAFAVAALVSAIGLGVAALNAQIDAQLYRRAVRPAMATVASMLAVTLAVIVWGAVLLASDGSIFWSNNGFLATSLPLNWLAILVVMLGACLVAVRTVTRLRTEAAETPV